MSENAGLDVVETLRRSGEDAKSVDQRGFDSDEPEKAMSCTFSKFFEAFLLSNGLRVSFDGFTVFAEIGAAFQGSDFANGSGTDPAGTAAVAPAETRSGGCKPACRWRCFST